MFTSADIRPVIDLTPNEKLNDLRMIDTGTVNRCVANKFDL